MKQKRTVAQTNVDVDDLRDRRGRLISAALNLTHIMEMLSSAELCDSGLDVSKGIDFYEEVTRFEVRLIEDAMRLTKGNQLQASALLGLNHTTLNTKLKRYKINRRAFSVYVSDDTLEELEQSKFYRAEMVEDRAPAPA